MRRAAMSRGSEVPYWRISHAVVGLLDETNVPRWLLSARATTGHVGGQLNPRDHGHIEDAGYRAISGRDRTQIVVQFKPLTRLL
jgi:hypothetical protein